MMTKKQFAKYLLKEEFGDEFLPTNENDIYKACFMSTNIGIAFETLGMIKDESVKEYLSNRGGLYFSYYDKETNKLVYLSTREILSFLPDTLEEDDDNEDDK